MTAMDPIFNIQGDTLRTFATWLGFPSDGIYLLRIATNEDDQLVVKVNEERWSQPLGPAAVHSDSLADRLTSALRGPL